MLSKYRCLYGASLHTVRRLICTGEAAITEPLHFLNGRRVLPTNPNADEDFDIKEPATGTIMPQK